MPQEKKLDEYTKDYFTPSSHGFRQSLPREKARANRAYRRQVHQRVATFKANEDDVVPERLSPWQVRREKVWKDGAVPMGEAIRRRLEGRVYRTARTKFFSHKYNGDADRLRFSRFLAAQVVSETDNSRRLAMHFKDILYLFGVNGSRYWQWHYDWLRAFLQDEPEWEDRLRTWIASFEQE
jgi:hypothetical protein